MNPQDPRMPGRLLLWGALFLLAGAASLRAGERKTIPSVSKKPLIRMKLKPGTLRLGHGMTGTIPPEAFRVALSKQRAWLLLDLDGDGTLRPGDGDGLALEGFPFVVPLPGTLLCEGGQCDLEVEKNFLLLRPQSLPIDPTLLAEVADLSEIRVRAGLQPVPVSAEASMACERHCKYLLLNHATGHAEDPGKPGYTPEGAKAGATGNIGYDDTFRRNLWGWYATPFHGWHLFNPTLRSVGVAYLQGEGAGSYAVLCFDEEASTDCPLFPHPPDGAVEVPCSFNALGEAPNPVPGTNGARSCGFPVVALLPREMWAARLEHFGLEEQKGGPVRGSASCPSAPATPDRPDNRGCAVFIPSGPLRSGTTYRARLKLEGHPELNWRFTTALRRN